MVRRALYAFLSSLLSLAAVLIAVEPSIAAISYTTAGGVTSETFDALPISPENASLQSTKPWTDDATSTATTTSLSGWYLYHTGTQTTEGGTNNHQRFRIGPGSSNTGSFYSFGTSATTDRALGDVTSSTIGTAYIAMRLTNNTGIDLSQFTLGYAGEQWRDGGATTPNAQTMTFDYAITSSAPTNISALSGTAVSALNFTSPTFTNTTSTGTSLDGNASANRTLLSATVGGFVWPAGQDLWLRWKDLDDAGNDHGLSIDDLSFSATAGGAEINSIANGLASSGSTWSNNQPPSGGNGYHVVGGFTVTLDGPFVGAKLSVENGVVDINATGSGQNFGAMNVEAGGNLTESVAGDVSIGADSTGSTLKLNRNVAFNLDGGSNFRLKAAVTGTGNLDFNEATPGSGNNAQVFLDAVSANTGTIHINAGKQVNVTETSAVNTIEMNSAQPGGNILYYAPKLTSTLTKLTFSQPGTFVHATNNPAGTPGQRLQNVTTFIANAPVNVDLSQPLSKEERRLQISGFQGSGNLTVTGAPTDPTDPAAAGTGITLNEFEVGAQSTDPLAGSSEPYSGTITANDYVNVEIRRNLPAAAFVVNNHARLETGAQAIPLAVNAGTTLGQVTVNSGGVFEVGFEQANAVGGTFVEGHHVNHAVLTNTSGRSGGLTLATGSTLRMQINGTDQNTQYDYINAHGNVSLHGTLDVLINPVSCTGNDPCGANANATYSPTLGDTFTIIELTSAPLAGDYSGNGSVGNEDYDLWRSNFGNTVTAGTAADGNFNGVVDAADYTIWRKNNGATTTPPGTLAGTFDALNVVDPGNALSFNGYALQLVYNANSVQLKVVSASGTLAGNVPEPTTIMLLGLAASFSLTCRRRLN